MPRVLVTAFEPYGPYRENASWLTLVELTRELPAQPQIVTRRYPVDYGQLRERLARDLAAGFDFALHLGQAPGSAGLRLEAFAVNAAGPHEGRRDESPPLEPDGPAAYRCSLPLAAWARRLREEGVPAEVSHHAGVYLCNAVLYLSHYFSERQGLPTRAAFLHVPLDLTQAVGAEAATPCLPAAVSARGVRLILDELAAGRST